MAQETRKTQETTNVKITYVSVSGKATGEYDLNSRYRIYELKSAKNYEELRSKKETKNEVVDIHYFKNEVEYRLNDLIKIDTSKIDFMDLSQVIKFQNNMNLMLDSLKVKSARIEVAKEIETGNIIRSSKVVVYIELF